MHLGGRGGHLGCSRGGMDILGAEGLDVVIILVSFASWWEGWALGGRVGVLGAEGRRQILRGAFFSHAPESDPPCM